MNAPRIPHRALNQTVRRTHAHQPLQVEGRIPTDLRGTLFRTGPGVRERFGRPIPHAFEADGVMSAVRFRDGAAHGAVQIVQSEGYLEEEQAGRPLYSTAASWLDRGRALFSGRGKATGNTSMWQWQGRLFALMEGLGPVEVSPQTLKTLGEQDLDGVIPRAFSAHPHYVPQRRASFNFGCRYGQNMEIDLFVLPDSGPARLLTTVTVANNAMVHDFVATDTHLLLLVCPAHLQSLRAMLGIGSLDTWYRWTPDAGTVAIAVPIDDPERARRFVVPPFWFWHTGNAWSSGDVLYADLSWYPDSASLAAIGTSDEASATPALHRCQLNLSTGQWDHHPIHEQAVDFPQVHPAALGRPHRTTFAAAQLSTSDHIGIARLDDGDLSLWHADAHEQASEPILVPRSSAEDDVWVLTLVHDDRVDRSCIAILDGQHLSDGPVARAWFDQPLPLTFHGTWMAS